MSPELLCRMFQESCCSCLISVDNVEWHAQQSPDTFFLDTLAIVWPTLILVIITSSHWLLLVSWSHPTSFWIDVFLCFHYPTHISFTLVFIMHLIFALLYLMFSSISCFFIACFACLSASLFPTIPTWAGTYPKVILIPDICILFERGKISHTMFGLDTECILCWLIKHFLAYNSPLTARQTILLQSLP